MRRDRSESDWTLEEAISESLGMLAFPSTQRVAQRASHGLVRPYTHTERSPTSLQSDSPRERTLHT